MHYVYQEPIWSLLWLLNHVQHTKFKSSNTSRTVLNLSFTSNHRALQNEFCTWICSVARNFFLKNTDVEPKKHKKHEEKSLKTREKHKFSAKFSRKMTLPTLFIAFSCINFFEVEKIDNIFSKNCDRNFFFFLKI